MRRVAPDESNSSTSAEQLARTLLSAKFTPPLIRDDVIGRERLLHYAGRDPGRKLILIHAPAGYGKTTLMVQWYKHLKHVGEGVGWLNMDERDNDAVNLLGHLQLALLPGSGREVLDALTVINRCAAGHRRFTLFLDELETVHTAQSMQLLELLLDYSPANLHVVIGTRFTPALPVSRLSVRHELGELDSSELRFVREEAAQFLRVRGGAELSAAALDEVLHKTEGWAAALQLAAASLARGVGHDAVMENLSGSKRQVMQYLAVDVVGKLPQPLREFLLATAGLSRLSAPLCDAVTGRTDSAMMLRKLEAANLFLQPLGEARDWYRYHALFAEFLQLQLREEAPDHAAQFARKASAWCADNGLLVEAIDYSLQAHDVDNAVALMRQAIGEQVRIGQFRTIKRWLAALPEALIDSQPHLIVGNAWARIYSQDFRMASKVIAQLRRLSDAPQTAEPNREALMLLEPVLLGALARRREAMECALDSWEKMDRGSLLVRGTLANILAFYSISLGRHEDAQRYLREAASAHTGPPLNPSGLAYTAGISAIDEASLGNLNGAIHLFRSIEKLVASYTAISYPGIELRFLPTIGIGCCAELLYERNDIDEADDYLDRYFRFTDSVLMLESNILVFLTKVRIHLARGDVNKAHDALEAASQHAIHTGLAWMAPMMVWERVRIALLDGDLDRARIQARAIELPGTADDARAFIHPYDEINGAGIETIRLLIHEGEAEQALQCLEAQIKHAAAGLRKRRLVKLYILQSMALAAMGRADAALEALLNAVRIGAGMPAVRSFVDEGERCLGLLQNLPERRALQVDAKTTVYVRSLINAFQSGRSSAPPPLTLQAKPLLGAISARELDILLRVSHGYSNLAIAQQLSLSANTVKWHLRHVYDKLGARNRNEAVFLARQRGLLA